MCSARSMPGRTPSRHRCGTSMWCARRLPETGADDRRGPHRRLAGDRSGNALWSGDPLPAAIPNQIADRGHESRLAPVLVHGVLRKGVASMNLEKIMAGAAISGALGFTALG